MMSVLSFTLRSENSAVGGGLLPLVATGDQISDKKNYFRALSHHFLTMYLLANMLIMRLKFTEHQDLVLTMNSSSYISMIVM